MWMAQAAHLATSRSTLVAYWPNRACGCLLSISKRRNTDMGADKPTLRASLWFPATALQRLTRTTAIACALRLVAKNHRLAEHGKITLKEYLVCTAFYGFLEAQGYR